MSWIKDEDGLWKKGDRPQGMEVGPVEWKTVLAVFAFLIIVFIAILIDGESTPRPEKETWAGWHIFGVAILTAFGLFVIGLVAVGLRALCGAVSPKQPEKR